MAVENSGDESRFGEITPRHISKGPHLSVYGSHCRISVRALAYFDSAGSVTPKYDSAADELALIPQSGDSGLRTLTPEEHGATIVLKSILQSRTIGIDVGELPRTVRLPIEIDPGEGVPYVPLAPLREAIEEGNEDMPHESGADEDAAESDRRRTRELLPPGRDYQDIADLARTVESSFGVARSLGVPREQAELLLEDLGLDEHVSMRGESA